LSTESIKNYPGQDKNILNSEGIPGVRGLAQHVAEAQESGVLFFLAVEIDLLLKQYLKKNGLPPTPVDLESIIAEAAKSMAGE
jgi:hypothetical protein